MSKEKSGAGQPPGRTTSTKVRVRAKDNRSESSRRWLERQLNDPYVAAAKKDGWRSRAAFKLIQIDEKFHILKRGCRVVDLGAAPGGWTQVALKKAGPGRVAGIDILPMDEIVGAVLIQGDFLAAGVPEKLAALLDGPPDVVLSDMAAPTTGHHRTDQIRTAALAEAALDFAEATLAPGGSFVAKTFQGGIEKDLLERMRRNFSAIRHAKPAASRQESAELYVVATGFRGDNAQTHNPGAQTSAD